MFTTSRFVILLILFSVYESVFSQQQSCYGVDRGQGSIACLCTEHVCDRQVNDLPGQGQYLQVVTNKDGLRFSPSYGYNNHQFSEAEIWQNAESILRNETVYLKLNRTKTFQKILGFGGAFTDSTGYLLSQVSEKLADKIISTLFGEKGNKYNMARVPIGHTDFSLNEYYYSDTPNDFEMKDWKLASADYNYKLPYMKKAKEIAEDDIYFLSSIWTVPSWMRSVSAVKIRSYIPEKYYSTFSLYLVKFLEAYKALGFDFWGISYANEPNLMNFASFVPEADKDFTTWPLNGLMKFAENYFIDDLKIKGFENTKIVYIDDNRNSISPQDISYLNKSSKIRNTIEAVGLHSYMNDIIRPTEDFLLKTFKNAVILTTEFCAGNKEQSPVKLGKWSYADEFANTIIGDLNSYHSAWIHWNFVLNLAGGPSYVGVSVNAPILIDTENGRFYKQPTYYVTGHFSRFMPRGSVRVQLQSAFPTGLQYTAVLRPDGLITAVVYNPTDSPVTVTFYEANNSITASLTPNSINTFVFV